MTPALRDRLRMPAEKTRGADPSGVLKRSLRPLCLRPEGPSARTGAAAGAAKPSRTDVRRPAFEGHEGEAFMQST
jgi:hypothetical protein